MKGRPRRVGSARLQQVYETFVSGIDAALTHAAMRDAMADAVAQFGLESFAYLVLPSRRATRPRIIASYPSAWTSHYLKRRYHRVDPVIRYACRRREPFIWDADFETNVQPELVRVFFGEAAEFGIRCGFTFPLHSRTGPAAAVTFATGSPCREFRQVFAQYGHVLELMAVLLHLRIRQRPSVSAEICGVRLTPRELECLEWAARGKSAADTASILGIAKSTVVFHLENTKTKLDVRTISQAVVCLARAQFPLPDRPDPPLS